MFVTNHALAGAAIGALTARPLRAFAAGVVSHVLMDMTRHYGDPDLGDEGFLRLARVDGTVGLGVTGAVALTAPRPARIAALAGLAGACLIDLDKPGRHFFGRSPFPRVVDELHSRIQNEAPHGAWVEAAATASMAAAAVAAFRYRGGRAERAAL